jgi:hypothetical protein
MRVKLTMRSGKPLPLDVPYRDRFPKGGNLPSFGLLATLPAGVCRHRTLCFIPPMMGLVVLSDLQPTSGWLLSHRPYWVFEFQRSISIKNQCLSIASPTIFDFPVSFAHIEQSKQYFSECRGSEMDTMHTAVMCNVEPQRC